MVRKASYNLFTFASQKFATITFMKVVISIFIFLLFFTGCSHYPMGLDKKSWEQLPLKTKVALQTKQAQMDTKIKLQQEKNRHIEKMQELALQKQRERRLDELYARAGYGDIVRVNFLQGCIKNRKKCISFKPISIILVNGETKTVNLQTRYMQETLYVNYDSSGIHINDNNNLNEFKAITLLPQRWRRGENYFTNLLDYRGKPIIKNLHIFVRYLPIDRTTSNSRYPSW